MVFSLVALPLHSFSCHCHRKSALILSFTTFSSVHFSRLLSGHWSFVRRQITYTSIHMCKEHPEISMDLTKDCQKWSLIYVYGQRVKRFDTHTISWIYSLQCMYVHEPKLQLVLWWSYGIDRTCARARHGEAERDFNLHRMGIHPSDHLDAWTYIYDSISIYVFENL